ncbi:hypothetical protein BS47DRAFT_98080 [Hydnum rufescens UP504]|uniref:Secreted protein n=1 Tax=Hydnum rufescens UP504 TaxID=1448309 RepID=A0A9P6DT43_9AGAM|nr:hypothetical protein BS47DRAFT_98080 [Hydnum rufescens UP504]
MMLRLVVASLVIENGLYAAFRACLHSPAPTVILLHPGLGLSLSFRLRHWIQKVMTIIRAFVYPILRFTSPLASSIAYSCDGTVQVLVQSHRYNTIEFLFGPDASQTKNGCTPYLDST